MNEKKSLIFFSVFRSEDWKGTSLVGKMLTGLLWLRRFSGGPSRLNCGSLRKYDRSTLNPEEEHKTKVWPALALANRFLLQTSQWYRSWHCLSITMTLCLSVCVRFNHHHHDERWSLGMKEKVPSGLPNPLIKFKFSQLKGSSKHWEGWSYSGSSEWVAEVRYWSQMERFCPPLLVTTTLSFSLRSGRTRSFS